MVPNVALPGKVMYFVIRCSEDGDITLSQFDKSTLERHLTEEYWGPNVQILVPPARLNLQEAAGIYIIKGELVIPKPVKVVDSWVVE